MWPVFAEIIAAATGYEQSNRTHLHDMRVIFIRILAG
jgi:hypothetical protein